MFKHYLAAALWSTTDESDASGGEPMDANYALDDCSPALVEHAKEACSSFLHLADEAGIDLSDVDNDQIAHDLWLSRNGHGAGFFDGPEHYGQHTKALQKLARGMFEVNLYVGDDGQLYFS